MKGTSVYGGIASVWLGLILPCGPLRTLISQRGLEGVGDRLGQARRDGDFGLVVGHEIGQVDGCEPSPVRLTAKEMVDVTGALATGQGTPAGPQVGHIDQPESSRFGDHDITEMD